MASRSIRYDALALTTMASGHLCLNLSDAVAWEAFPTFANEVLEAIGGQRRRGADGADMRLWEIVVDGQTLKLVFDDFPEMVSLESQDAHGDALLRKIYASLAGS